MTSTRPSPVHWMALATTVAGALAVCHLCPPAAAGDEALFTRHIEVAPQPVSDDPSVRWDYPLVYVRALGAGNEVHKRFYTDFATPVALEPGADLVLLHPDGREEVLAEGGRGSITDPAVSFLTKIGTNTSSRSTAGSTARDRRRDLRLRQRARPFRVLGHRQLSRR